MEYIRSFNFKKDNWTVEVIGYYIYFIFFLISLFFEENIFRYIGSFLLLYVIILGNYKKFPFLKKDILIFLPFLLIIFSTLNLVISKNYVFDYNYYFKYLCILLIFIIIYSLNLVEIDKSNKKKYFLFSLTIILLISLIIEFQNFNKSGIVGVFVNPNNFALFLVSFLIFINEVKTSITKLNLIFITIFILMLFTSTTGAVVSYLCSLIYKYRFKIFKIFKFKNIAIFIIILIIFINFVIFFQKKINEFESYFIIFNKIKNQFYVIVNYYYYIDESNINYYTISLEYGPKSLSGLWRLNTWWKAIKIFYNSNLTKKLFGYGVGSSRTLLSVLPHNDFLRILLEQGFVGFVIIFMFYLIIFKNINDRKKYIFIFFVLYSLTENNLDNFLFMILFMFFCGSYKRNNK